MLNSAEMASLVSKAKNGKKSAFKELYSATSKSVYFVLLKRLGDKTLAMDVLQETYLSAYKNIGKLEKEITFIAWINRIAYNLSADHLKAINKRAVEIEFSDENLDIEDLDTDFIPEAAVIKEEARQLIIDAIDALPEIQKTCVLMFYYDELSAKEIATIMNITENSVFKRLQHARHTLKRRLATLAEKGGGFYVMSGPSTLTLILQKEATKCATPELLNAAWAAISIGMAEATPAAGAIAAATMKTWVAGVAVVSTVAAVAVVTLVKFGVPTVAPTETPAVIADVHTPDGSGEIAENFIAGIGEDAENSGELESPGEQNEAHSENTATTVVGEMEELPTQEKLPQPEELPIPSETAVPFFAQESLFGSEATVSPTGNPHIKPKEAPVEATADTHTPESFSEEVESNPKTSPSPSPSDKTPASQKPLFAGSLTLTYQVHKVTVPRELALQIATASGGTIKPGDISDEVLEQFNGAKVGQYILVIEKENELWLTVTVNVVDTIPPVINVERWSLVYEAGSVPSTEEILKDAGVTVTDNSMVPVAAEIIGWDEISGVAGSKYVLRVTAADESGNKALEKKIVVFIK